MKNFNIANGYFISFVLMTSLLLNSCKTTKSVLSANDEYKTNSSMENAILSEDINLTSNNSYVNKSVKSIDVKRNAEYQVTDIIFKSTSGDIKSSFNIVQNDPYRKKYADNLVKNSDNLFVFRDKNLNDFLDPNHIENYQRETELSYIEWGKTSCYTNIDSSSAIVAYNFNLGHKSEILGNNSMISVINQNGDKVYSIDNLEVNCNSAALTSDRNYLIFSYGIDDEYGYLLYNGYRIYDINNNKLLVDDSFINNNMSSITVSTFDNLILIRYKLPCENAEIYSQYKNFVFFDMLSKTRYSYQLEVNKNIILKEISNIGLVVESSGIIDTISLRNDFKIEKIETK